MSGPASLRDSDIITPISNPVDAREMQSYAKVQTRDGTGGGAALFQISHRV